MYCSQQEDDPCYTCGSAVSKHVIISCSRCGDRQHLWCMRPMLMDIPSKWICHECQMQDISFLPTQVRDDVSFPAASTMPSLHSPQYQKKKINEPKRSKVRFLPASEAAGLLAGDARNGFFSVPIPVRKRSQHHGRSPPSAVKPSAPVRDFCQLTEALRENRDIKGKGNKAADTVKPFTRQDSSIIPGDRSSDRKVTRREHESTDEVKHKEWTIIEKFTKNPIETYAIWSGQFEILDGPDHGVYCGLQGLIPRWVELKACIFPLSLPSLLSLKLIPRKVLWDQIFKDTSPNENDVVLYMLPKFSDREPFQHLTDMLDSSDWAMHTYIDGVELIVFTSKWLETCAESEGQNFLWGLYRDRIHECIVFDKEANGHEGTRKAIKEELLEFPPGYEAQHCWKKRKA